MSPNALRTAMAERRFVCSAELVLGRDRTAVDAEAFVKDAAAEPDGIKVINLTDLPGNPAPPLEAFAELVLAHGLTPLAQVTGKDGDRAFLQARLHEFAMAGVENILAITGDAQREGFPERAKPVHGLDSVLILRMLAPFDFFPGAVVNPFQVREVDLMLQLCKLRLKIAAGARFIVTQAGFNLRKLYELKQHMEREGLGEVPVMANVYVPTATVARRMHSGELAGCVASADFVKRVGSDSKAQRLERAALMVAAARDLGFAGAHIGGFGLSHRDFMTILERSSDAPWREHLSNLVFPCPGEFYLFPLGADGLSDATHPCSAGHIAQTHGEAP